MKKPYHWLYIIECVNGSFYTGYTENIARRYFEHIIGIGAAYTHSFKPDRLAQCWRLYDSKGMAMRIEDFIKSCDRNTKNFIVKYPERLRELIKDKLGMDVDIYTCHPHLAEWNALQLDENTYKKSRDPFEDFPEGDIGE